MNFVNSDPARNALNSFADTLIAFLDDPAHWTNNKRRLHGLPLLRKDSNRRSRFQPNADVYISAMEIVDKLLRGTLQTTIDSFACISDLPYGRSSK